MPKSVAGEVATQGHHWHRVDVSRPWLMEGGENSGDGWEGDRDSCLPAMSPLPLPTVYVGLATVAAATWWFLYDAEGPQVTFYQLVSK